MAIQDDISIAGNGDIRYTGAGANYTVIELHRFLGDLMDDAEASGDDVLDITSATASERSTDNIITLNAPYNIDDTLAEHLYDGSVIQSNGDTIYDGIVNFGTQGIHIEIMQNGALVTPNFWTTGLNADSNAGISHRFLVKVRTAAADIDGRRLIGMARELGKSYSEFPINGTQRGNNVLALSHADDLNNQTAEATIATWTNITNTEGYRLLDVNGDASDEPYYSEWDRDTQSINDLFERLKWLSRRGTSSTLYGLSGDLFRGITHQVTVDTPTGTWNEVEPVSWSGGTGQLLAIDSTTAPTKMWIQLLTGVAPTDTQTITGGTSAATADVNVTVTARPIATPFAGASTGAALIGSYGLGVEPSDLTASDKLTDLGNVLRVPPNNVTFTVFGLVSGEDRVLVAPESGGGIDVSQLTLFTTLSGAAETAVDVSAPIPSDTPSTGTIRIQLDSGIYRRVTYTSYGSQTFTIPATDFTLDNATNPRNVWISYVDKLAAAANEGFTGVYSSDRSLFVRVRDGGGTPIKTFQTTGTLGSAGGSATAIRTADA